MDYRKMGNTVYIRVDKDEKIVSTLLKVCDKEQIKSAFLIGLGCCSEATIFSHFPDNHTNQKHSKKDVLEMENLTGTISLEDDGTIVSHVHAIFTYYDKQREQHIFAGHLIEATVLYTTELTLTIAPEIIGQITDPITGIRVLGLHAADE